ncbi:MAG: hypothetical protein H7281_08250 [Bacteriovorax sp.]|nr:hypothetical protein [Bacteriovorax sp.]
MIIKAMTFAILLIISGCVDAKLSSEGLISTTTVTEVSCSGVVANETINIQAYTFSSGSVAIFDEQVVKWKNLDPVTHSVTSGLLSLPDGKFNITLQPNTERCLRFINSGAFTYFCKFHSNMTAEVIVQ